MKFVIVEQGSSEWKKEKAGVITGTRLEKVMGSKTLRENIKMELVSEILTGQIAEVPASLTMQRGTNEEPFAIKEYKERTGKDIQEFGLILHEKYPFIGVSPDGLTGDLKHAVEVKNPNSSTHARYLVDGKLPKKYYWQVVQYFVVIDTLETLDFISHDSRVKLDKLKLMVCPVTRKEIQEDADKALNAMLQIKKEVDEIISELTF